jgi:hypothetical protein
MYRLVFVLAALDRTGWGLWTLVLPNALFTFLQWHETPGRDQVLLWRVLGGLALVHALFLVILLAWPEASGPAVLVPLFGLVLGTGVWLWIAATERLALPSRLPPLLLAAHDAVWLPALIWFLVAWHRWRQRADSSLPSRH